MYTTKQLKLFSLAIVLIVMCMLPTCQLTLATHDDDQGLSTTTSCEFPAIFNFGDSNSDTGGGAAAFGQIGPPHGETFFHAPAGRYSDGRHVIDFIAESFGLPYLNAYLDSVGSNFSNGVNFATAGSTIRKQNTTSYSPFSLKIQFNQFRDFQQHSKIFRDKGDVFKTLLPKAEYFSKALYTFDLGQNDLTASFPSNMSSDQVEATISDILGQFKTNIKSIYDLGARYFWIHNTGPLGCLPYVLYGLSLNATQVDEIGCAISINQLAQLFNFGLKKFVVQLREDMPLATITYVDIYSIKYKLLSQANKYGFIDPLKACCGQGGKYNYDPKKGCGAWFMDHGKGILVGSCKDPRVKIIWDGAHYTDAANKWIFNLLANGSYLDPPNPLKMACYRQ